MRADLAHTEGPLLTRLADLVGCVVAHVDLEEGTVVFWNGQRTLLRYRLVEGALTEAGSYTSCQPLLMSSEARALAARVSYR